MKQLLIIALTLICSAVFGQNLVSNPSFEEYSNCPTDLGQVENSNGWFSARLTPDYFNSCSTNPESSVPDNYWGNQAAFSGSAYAGFTAFQEADIREVLGTQLNTPLTIGTKYFVTFYCSLYNAEQNMCASNNIGITFSKNEFNGFTDTVPLNNQSLVFSDGIVTDTTDWVQVKGSFTSDSAYQYIYLGNLFDDANTQHIVLQPLGARAYYFVDKVCVSADSLTCETPLAVNENVKQYHLAVFPNPTSNVITVKCADLIRDIVVRDIYGRLVMQIVGIKQNQIDISVDGLTTGIYTVAVVDDRRQRQTRRILKK